MVPLDSSMKRKQRRPTDLTGAKSYSVGQNACCGCVAENIELKVNMSSGSADTISCKSKSISSGL